jgi:hypothetical protein
MTFDLTQPWSLNPGLQTFPEPIEPDCFAEDCDNELGDDEFRYPEGVRRVAPVFYDAE